MLSIFIQLVWWSISYEIARGCCCFSVHRFILFTHSDSYFFFLSLQKSIDIYQPKHNYAWPSMQNNCVNLNVYMLCSHYWTQLCVAKIKIKINLLIRSSHWKRAKKTHTQTHTDIDHDTKKPPTVTERARAHTHRECVSDEQTKKFKKLNKYKHVATDQSRLNMHTVRGNRRVWFLTNEFIEVFMPSWTSITIHQIQCATCDSICFSLFIWTLFFLLSTLFYSPVGRRCSCFIVPIFRWGYQFTKIMECMRANMSKKEVTRDTFCA